MQAQHPNSLALTFDDTGKKPWKYVGYQTFSRFVSSDNDFFILRRFGALTARVLLGLQDQLSSLEERLQAIEDLVRQRDALDIHNGSFRQETHEERRQLLSQIQHVLREYNELVIQHSQIRARPQVPKRDVCSIDNWFHNNGNAILEAEMQYTKHPSDLFSLVPASKTPLRLFFERSRHFRMLSFWKSKRIESDDTIIKNDYIHYRSDQKIDRFIAIFITFLGIIMLIAPLWVLAFLDGLVRRLSVISSFIVLFVVLLSFTTVARPFESLAAAAAYSAVLMVFLQISGST